MPCADDQTIQTNFIQFHFRDLRFFFCSLLLLHCASFLLLKLLFSFFMMTFSVSTVQLSEFILFGGKKSFFTLAAAFSDRLNMHIALDARV